MKGKIKPIKNTGLDELMDLFKKTKLNPELEACIVKHCGMTFMKHPLVVGIYCEALNNQMNESLKFKKQKVAQCLTQEDWEGYIFLHERPFRLDAIMRLVTSIHIEDKTSPEDLAELILSVYTDAEFPCTNRELFLFLFRRFFDDTELQKKARENTPNILFRGTAGDELKRSQLGLSWTTDYSAAEMFSRKTADFNHKKPRIYVTKPVPPSAVFAQYSGRKEGEWICDPHVMRQYLTQHES